MPTYPLDTLAPTITPDGITTPAYVDIFASLQASMRIIFGNDLYIEPDSQDGQMIAVVAFAINDTNNAIVAVYNSYSPATAQGTALSSLVKINGITRNAATNSTAVVTIVGASGTTINNGRVTDLNGIGWSLPATVTIPVSGTIDETVTCEQLGAIKAPAGTLIQIATPTPGWQTVTNPLDATPGAPVETDAALRRRQTDSVALPAIGNLEAIMAAVSNVSGVQTYKGYENPTGDPDADGIPAHSIAVVVEGGDALAICEAIALKKSPGTGTYGSVSETITDIYGIPVTIHYFPLARVQISVAITIKALAGYASTTGDMIKQEVSDFISGLDIGTDVYLSWVYGPAQLGGNPSTEHTPEEHAALRKLSETYVITALAIARTPATPTPANVVIAFNEAATCATTDITITVI